MRLYGYARLSGNGDRSGLSRMMELAMTAFHAHLNPAVNFQQIDQFRDFHLESLLAMQKWRIGMTPIE